MNAPLKIKCKKARYRNQLDEEFTIFLSFLLGLFFETKYFRVANGFLTVKILYAWDGLSIPLQKMIFKIRWFGPWLERTTLIASLVHDVLYQIIRLNLVADHKLFKLHGDRTLRMLCVAGGAWRWLSWVVYEGVRIGGNPYIEPKKEPSAQTVELAKAVSI